MVVDLRVMVLIASLLSESISLSISLLQRVLVDIGLKVKRWISLYAATREFEGERTDTLMIEFLPLLEGLRYCDWLIDRLRPKSAGADSSYV